MHENLSAVIGPTMSWRGFSSFARPACLREAQRYYGQFHDLDEATSAGFRTLDTRMCAIHALCESAKFGQATFPNRIADIAAGL